MDVTAIPAIAPLLSFVRPPDEEAESEPPAGSVESGFERCEVPGCVEPPVDET